jgi:hypothetical protein
MRGHGGAWQGKRLPVGHNLLYLQYYQEKCAWRECVVGGGYSLSFFRSASDTTFDR